MLIKTNNPRGTSWKKSGKNDFHFQFTCKTGIPGNQTQSAKNFVNKLLMQILDLTFD